MDSPFHVLVFPGGTEIGLEIHAALNGCKEVRLFSAGLDVPNHAPFVFQHHVAIPSIHQPGWIDALNEAVERWEIDFIFPAYDDILVALAENAGKLKARVVTSPLRTCQITRSKSQTYRALEKVVPTPRLYQSLEEVQEFPVFVKPDRGQGSQGAMVVRDHDALATALRLQPHLIILECLTGPEYTIDCFSDREQGLLFCGGRERTRTKSGISMSSRIVDSPLFAEYAKAISSVLSMHGAWFLQLKKDRAGIYTLLEVAPRIAGTMALHRVKGINFPLLSLYENLRAPFKLMPLNVDVEIDRALTNRYRHNLQYKTVYVDLDDTLILNGAVNTKLVAFLYQALNNGCRIVLLTRHEADIDQTLSRYRLAQVFDEIIYVPRPTCKSESVTESNAIFIDDSFSERVSVMQNRGIPTLDCSMIEMLIDERK